ncbi:prostaglandin E synthase 2-like [Aphidius gifuensis]|uniref:prostaglandin E synthase 2-like n=1 Tax=Aphidius gifuensis TaxID=684658 RepID=UPI001CDBADB7|nr:prostaglandin E synthase 2-like [Aphidius gifuensis]
MSVLCRFSRLSRNFLIKNPIIRKDNLSRGIRTVLQDEKPSRGILKTSFIGGLIGAAIGVGYAFNKIERDRKNLENEGHEIPIEVIKYKPAFEVSRKIVSPVDSTGLKLTLFQYQSCPFCCKVRTFLDYYGISYDVVEVEPVFRPQIKWSSYKKVPILLAKVDNGYQPLNDSTMIVSVLASYLNDKTYKINELTTFYPKIAINDENGKFKEEIVNKYFLMYQGSVPKDRTLDDIVEERKWRKWADEVFVHTLSPNVYRTINESYQTFNIFSDAGKWDEYFSSWERLLMINIGALAMYFIGKRLKKRHHLKDDVRQSFYDEINIWINAINARGGVFMGGQNPDLSDLTVYGILRSIEGCDAFKDAFENTQLANWYQAMTDKVKNHAGSNMLGN